VALVLSGTVVTFDRDARILRPGRVYLGDDGKLAGVGAPSDPVPTGFSNARQLDVDGVIYPGLVDLHSHMAYNTLPLWEAPRVPYLHHDRWVDEEHPPDYASTITWPSRVVQQAAAEALIKYVEVKALVGGTTALQGAPDTTRAVDGWLVRVVDKETFGTNRDLVRTSALQKRVDLLRADARKLRDEGGVLIYHVAEGPVGSIVHQEFGDLDTAGCLRPGLIGVHATALQSTDFESWQQKVKDIDANERATVVWSPFSNLWLYEQTTDVVEARKKGLRIALGSDWAPSGTKHVLGEVKVADLLNKRRFDRLFTNVELCEMVTSNPGDALSSAGGQLGRLQTGAEADVVVVERHKQDLHRNLIDATEEHIQLVVVRGKPFYGTPEHMKAAGASRPNTIRVRGLKRAVLVRMPGRKDATLTWPGVLRALDAVRRDPVGSWNSSLDALAAWGGPLDAPDAPLLIFGDMPQGNLGALGATGEIPSDVKVPAPDSLEHDQAFFAAIARANPPELAGLADYYP
jgi:5-methylthioadenosine/S-adenosylhomocysteine deaminase